MAEGTLIATLDRIEAAIGRIEAQAEAIGNGRPGAVPVTAPEAQPDDIEHRHRELQTSVESALARIDALIAGQSE